MEHFPDGTVSTIVTGFESLLEYIQRHETFAGAVLQELRTTPVGPHHNPASRNQLTAVRDAMKAIDRLRAGRYLHDAGAKAQR